MIISSDPTETRGTFEKTNVKQSGGTTCIGARSELYHVLKLVGLKICITFKLSLYSKLG